MLNLSKLDPELKLFEKLPLEDGELEFLENVLASRNPDFNERLLESYKTISTIYLSKQIESASKSSDKSANAMKWLTGAIALFTLCQVLIAIFK